MATPSQLTVQYISAETGLIVGDENRNGLRDADELAFAEFAIHSKPDVRLTDLNDDGTLDDADLDLLCAAVLAESLELRFDLNRDQVVDRRDHQFLVASGFGTTVGDANLDRIVNSADLVRVFQTGHYESNDSTNVGWSEGDWNCDGAFTSADLVVVFQLGVYQV